MQPLACFTTQVCSGEKSMATPSEFKTKLVSFLGRDSLIILQNENGPCPLIAIANVLLLRNVLSIPFKTTSITLDHLLTLVTTHLLDSNTSGRYDNAEYEQVQKKNLEDVMPLLPQLGTGIDVNVKYHR